VDGDMINLNIAHQPDPSISMAEEFLVDLSMVEAFHLTAFPGFILARIVNWIKTFQAFSVCPSVSLLSLNGPNFTIMRGKQY
jgi:hypothetical protein